MRDWLGIPRFSHGLIDQSGLQPEEVEGELKTQIMQLLLMAAYHPERPWGELVVNLLNLLSSFPPSGGINYVRAFLIYILQTQDRDAIESFQDALHQHAPEVGDDFMTYAQELLAQGEIRAQVRMIEGFLREEVEWSVIERATGVNEAQFQALKQQVEDMND